MDGVEDGRARGLNARGVEACAWGGTDGSSAGGGGAVVYYCDRDARTSCNDALARATRMANGFGVPLVVAMHVGRDLSGRGIGGARRAVFGLEGRRELDEALRGRGAATRTTIGDDAALGVLETCEAVNASAVVCDFTPLREGRATRATIARALECPVVEVDAHNVVPAWVASDKQEYAARTIRPKIRKKLDEFLTAPTVMDDLVVRAAGSLAQMETDWAALVADARANGAHVPEVHWIKPGEKAALASLLDPSVDSFLPDRLALYGERNKPTSPRAVSRLSPYLNHGQLAPRRAAWEAVQLRGIVADEAIDSYLEELIIRRELSDNFCLYNPDYDSLRGASQWAQDSLALHASDKREYVYDYATLERAKTHDELWNAAQKELYHLGRMHGFMRMYWAKKILEWTPSPEIALETAIQLNDTYALDGLDPNGYVGCMWSIAGVHDQGWKERAVFGKVRYMNYAGCKRKFDIGEYVRRIESETRGSK
ncbi:DNA photolyase, class 2 [Ostreococcus tauri]|uniref:Deoxyribodipyrimidine photo-lyase n=1 Tax=Ostreococcus tauri TaxID=70448 RepID=Q00X10_OSTTA|nr:DNA photolyase, class 2 [Ostreococcus tauri]OUS46275.1 class II DNA photolyase [Ostreococcus tauri]CAL56501.1 DNA photolyase, class 2 [Ostreococcus tauri]|eukprot:XP_003082644.1 DNA photolyase, class 2 [Ostreococcus tauri]